MDVHPIKNVSIGIDPYPYRFTTPPQPINLEPPPKTARPNPPGVGHVESSPSACGGIALPMGSQPSNDEKLICCVAYSL